jgi:hypothetical protein
MATLSENAQNARSAQNATTIELAPSYKIPLVLAIAAIPLLGVLFWVGLLVGLFGLFLIVQTATIRLRFTASDLDVYRSDKLLRRFPYQDWLNWQIFWEPFPILFYFREVKSIHFLPVLFDSRTLKSCLETHVPKSTPDY